MLHLTSRTQQNGQLSWEYEDWWKVNLWMWSSTVRSACCFSPFLKATLSVNASSREGLLWKKDSVHVRQRNSAHVSNNITQTSCFLQHLVSLWIAPSSSLPASFAVSAPLKRLKWRHRNLQSFHLISELSASEPHIHPDCSQHSHSCWSPNAAYIRT